jgi:hypothetical protein
MSRWFVCAVAGLILTFSWGTAVAKAEETSGEPTRERCEGAVEEARAEAAKLPADDLSRYFAERDLHQALVEAGNGEFDDCMEATARATLELRERRHSLAPGERLQVLRPDQ